MRICYECPSFINLEPNSVWQDIWYNHLCQANPLPKARNPVTGKIQSYTKNDFGQTVYVDNEYEYCRDMNPEGDCRSYLNN